MQNTTQVPEQLFGNEVVDSSGSKIGTVDNVWVDDATNELEFVGVKTGFLMGKTHVIPISDAKITEGTIQIPYSQDQVKDAPTFSGDAELSPDQETAVYSHYGVQRSTSPSPTGLASENETQSYQWDSGNQTDQNRSSEYDAGRGNIGQYEGQNMALAEENLQVDTRQVDAGQVRLRKIVRHEQVEVPVELRREDVEIERVPATGNTVSDSAFQEQEITVPLSREEPVVNKEARVTGEVQVNKTAQTESRMVGDSVRREDVEVDRGSETTGSNSDAAGYEREKSSEFNR